MSQDAKKPSADKQASDENVLLAVFKTMADTTWRMFVPTAVGAAIGLWVDNQIHAKFFGIVGSLLGLGASIVLVWNQYKNVTKKD